MNMYADFEYYRTQYNGTLITDKNQFERQAIEACCLIDEMTMGRIRAASDEVKRAVCAVCEISYREDKQDQEAQIASESVGPHSVSYVKQTKSKADFLSEKRAIIKRYLWRTGLLYRGVPSCGL